jgi:alkylhydroperoxidase family enzyme
MIRRAGHALVRAFERRHAYDAAYLHDILDASPAAFLRLLLAQSLGAQNAGAGAGARFAARFAAVRHEDCGPCAQLVIDMARAEGVAPAVLRAVVSGDTAALPEDVALALGFAEAVLAHAVPPELEQAVETRFGPRGRITLAYAIASTRSYPVLKRALGHARSCARLRVDDVFLAPRAPLA